MNYNVFLKISLILLILSTLCICIFKPKMHTKILIYDSNFSIVEQKIETVEKNLPTISQKQEPEQKTEKVIAMVEQETLTKTPKTTTVKLNKTTKSTPVKIDEKKQITFPKKVLTEQQEEIQWNIWRSNLQNQIMKDVKLPIIPQGTIFKFEFDVDKYGKVSNVQTWSATNAYTPYAIQYIAPVIRSYQGHSILNFPQGSNRTQTHVIGGWKIASNVKYSTPKDYNDTEKIKK